MLSNTELLLVQLNSKMDRIIELLEEKQPIGHQKDAFDSYLYSLSLRHSSLNQR